MKAITNFIVSVLLLVSALSVHAQGTAFSYQGRLNSGTNPANGTYDLTFALFNVVSGAGQVGATLTNSTIAVSNGLFTVFLDFGANFPGANRWLEIGARTNGIGTFTTLAPRQKITPTPYAITASNLTGVLPATQLTGTLPSAQLAGTYGTALSFNNAANVFAGNGSGLINLNPTSILWGSCPPWSICGNAGTTAGVNFLGTTDNQPLELKSFGQRALRLEATGGAPNVIGGRSNNFVAAGEAGGAIGGGEANGISSSWGTVAGGIGNTVGSSSAYSSIGGGRTNRIFNSGGAVHSTIGGGHNNTIGDSHGTIGGGADNYISFGTMVTIAGGWGNQVGGVLKADSAAIGGGEHNIINAVWCGTIAGGLSNVVGGAIFGAIGGGKNNFVGSDSGTIAGGENNLVPNNSSFSGIGGGRNNRVSATDATIAGGNGNSITNAPFADGCALGSTIGGGLQNSIIAYCTPYWGGSTIGGGYSNIIRAANSCTVGGGQENYISGQTTLYSTIGGGFQNLIGDGSGSSFIGGGKENFIDGFSGTIAGGYSNRLNGFCDFSSIGGGTFNLVGFGSSYITIAGGNSNRVSSQVDYATVAGGSANSVSGSYGSIPGGRDNSASGYALAAGRRAKANHQGAFVWADSTDADFASGANNEAAFRCNGGVRFTSDTGGGNQTVSWTPGSASWSFSSDRNLKEGFAMVDGKVVLDKLSRLPLSEWNYKGYAQRHIGPMAQDFHALFPLNESETTLNSADLDGVALAVTCWRKTESLRIRGKTGWLVLKKGSGHERKAV